MLTDDGRWVETGQGETGEVLLIGEDRLLRSQSRFMATDPDKFLEEAQAQGLPPSVAEQIRTLGTTILYMPAHNAAVEGAFHNRSGLARFLDYRGVEVVSAYGPVDVAGLRWAIEAKQDAIEAFAPAIRLQRALLVAAAAAAIVLTFVALVCARLFMRPLDRVIAGMGALASSGHAPSLERLGNDEFGALGRGYNAMVATISKRDRQVTAAELKTDELLRRFYPAGLVDRARGDSRVTGEKIENVTVAVTWIDGLDGLAANLDASAMADVLNTMLDAISGAAAGHAVEPIRSLGESHILVCGLSSPQLDHASRTLAWTQSAALVVQRLKTDWASSISLRFGLASGEIDVLLLERGHAPYDIWGRTLSIARLIALQAQAGVVQVDESTYNLLTDVTGFQPEAPIVTPALGTLRTWTREAGRPLPLEIDADPRAGADHQAKAAE